MTIVNEHGQIVLDTLISQNEAPPLKHRQDSIHGITRLMIKDAPTLNEVHQHILDIIRDQQVIFIGHSAKTDLKVMRMDECEYVDTQPDHASGEPRALKDQGAIKLNVRIQEGTHSSIVDARVSLGLFLFSGKNITNKQVLSSKQQKIESSEKGCNPSKNAIKRKHKKMCSFISEEVVKALNLQF